VAVGVPPPPSPNISASAKELVKQLGASLSAQEGATFREEPAMADKAEFVDMISEATQQTRRRRVMPKVVAPVAKETSRLGHWPPDRWEQWRMENLTPWKLRPWRVKDWD
jgi:hypothetical protein